MGLIASKLKETHLTANFKDIRKERWELCNKKQNKQCEVDALPT